MKITAVRVFEIEGHMQDPIAVFHSVRAGAPPHEPRPYRDTFVQIETDEGVSGLQFVPYGVEKDIKPAGELLIGEDPRRIEALWEKLWAVVDYRMHIPVIATLDLALWDLVGNIRNAPVHELLGGPTRDRVRAYAGMLGFNQDPAAAAETSLEYVEKGFTALKWYLPYSGKHGQEGIRGNVALIRAVRDAVGPDIEIMVDCFAPNSHDNSVLWTIELARALEELKPKWIEEPLNFDDMDSHRRLSESTSIPVAFGEHFYNRWDIKRIIKTGNPMIVQPDPMWAGGVSEMQRIMAICSTYGVVAIPHGNESCRNAVAILFAQQERTSPYGEWGVKINPNSQHFYKTYYEPVDGFFPVPTGPGFGVELDEEKILNRTEL